MEKGNRMLGRHKILILLAVFALAIAACDSYVNEDELVSQGETVYTENCASCHQLDGQGYPEVYPNLTGNPVVTLHDPSPLIQIVKYGRGGMPAFRADLNSEEIAAVLSYIRNAWDNDAAIVTPKETR